MKRERFSVSLPDFISKLLKEVAANEKMSMQKVLEVEIVTSMVFTACLHKVAGMESEEMDMFISVASRYMEELKGGSLERMDKVLEIVRGNLKGQRHGKK